MSVPTHVTRAGGAAIALVAACVALAAVPLAAQASPVLLGTVQPFVVLAGSTATNSGPSVLNGELGLSPGTAYPGFGPPAVVNGATHIADAVALKAQNDLVTAYDVAAGQPVAPANDLSGTDLGNRTLLAGAYRYTSSAQLTGPLTLDAQGDPNAQFVFEIGSALTTASASSVVLLNGADPCKIFWQIGSSATLGTTTAFQGNVMALQSISLQDGATVQGRLLARNGAVTLINNVINAASCGATTVAVVPTTPGSPGTPGGPGSPGTPGNPASPQTPPGSQSTLPTRRGTSTMRRTAREDCTDGYTATVHGRLIRSVYFRLDGKRLAYQTSGPFKVYVVAPSPGIHHLSAKVTYKDLTKAKTLRFRYRACAAGSLQPRRGPSVFTG